MLLRYSLVLLLGALNFYGCDDQGSEPKSLPCKGACTAGLICVNEQCILPDQGLELDQDMIEETDQSVLDQMLNPEDPQRPAECQHGETRDCPEQGSCSQAFQRCINGVWGSCATPQESCDALDNDCDGLVDEGYGLGDECEVGQGQCLQTGVLVCNEAGGVQCDQVPSEASPELCNGLDDDCDGRTDEIFQQLGANCELGIGSCKAIGQVVCGGDGAPTCNAVVTEAEDEQCDGVDNDCDGLTDEADPQLDQECESRYLGICQAGFFACRFGQLVCEPNAQPAQEVCDQLDNDCDGLTDEEGPDLGSVCSAGLEGQCDQGLVVCTEQGEWFCESQVDPQNETCNGLDDDCDGYIDEVIPELGELCDTSLLGACSLGQYACRQGVLLCDELIQPLPETCNNLDEDCDGFVDEDTNIVERSCDTGERGVCGAGIEVCELGELICRRAEPPREELCDNRDNDCDGFVDEDFRTLGNWCELGVGACKAEGYIGCAPDHSEARCLALPYEPQAERCDEVDNDCNGIIDDLTSAPQEPQNCGACGAICEIPHAINGCEESVCVIERCAFGWFDSNNDASDGCETSCIETTPNDEVCDGLDNDCDGMIDSNDCIGDQFRFCENRINLGIYDEICETFSPDQAQWSHWPLALIRAGTDALNLDRLLEGGSYPFLGGSVTRRVKLQGPSYLLGFHVDYRDSALGIGMFESQMRDPNDPNPPNDSSFIPGEGYSLIIESIDGVPTARVYRSPDQYVLWSGQVSALGDRLRHWVQWQRLNDGSWQVKVDGQAIVPQESAEADQSINRFDRLSLWLGPADEQSSLIDSYALRYDEDNDDVYRPIDNCPYVFNPAQIDLDEDGRGLACDDQDSDGIENGLDLCNLIPNPAQLDQDQNGIGDACDFPYSIAIGASFGGPLSVWTIDLKTGVNHSNEIPANNEGFDAHSSLDGWWAWSNRALIWLRSPEDTEATRVEMGFEPDFIGENLIFVSLDHQSVMKMPRDLSDFPRALYTAENQNTLTIKVGPLEEQIVVIEKDENDYLSIFELSPDGIQITNRVYAPSAAGGEFPKLSRHPQRNQYLISALDGIAQGISLLDGSTGILEPISYRPTGNAVFTPNGDAAIAIYPSPEGNIIERRGLSINANPQSLYGPSTFISIDGLEPVPTPPELPDTDGDGRPDEIDSCPDLPQIQAVQSQQIEGIPLNTSKVKLYELADGFALAWDENRTRGLLRINHLGEVLNHIPLENTQYAYANSSALHAYFPWMHWVKDHYELVYFDSQGAWHREVKQVPLTHDWYLGIPTTLTNTDTDQYNFFPLIWGGRLMPTGYRVEAASYSGGTRALDLNFIGEEVNFNQTLGGMGANCIQALPLADEPPSNEPSLYQCLVPYQRQIASYQRNTAGIVLESNRVSLEDLGESGGLWQHDLVFGRQINNQIGMSVYVDKLFQARARALDQEGRPYSIDRVISADLEGVTRIRAAAGQDRFGVLFVADAPEGVKGLYFVSVDSNAQMLSNPLLMTPLGVGISKTDMIPELTWDGEAWIAIWGDDRGGFYFSRGRFDCP